MTAGSFARSSIETPLAAYLFAKAFFSEASALPSGVLGAGKLPGRVPCPLPWYFAFSAAFSLFICTLAPLSFAACPSFCIAPRAFGTPAALSANPRMPLPMEVPANAENPISLACCQAVRASPWLCSLVPRFLYLPAVPIPAPCVAAAPMLPATFLASLAIPDATCPIIIMSRRSPIKLPVVLVTVAPNWDMMPSNARATCMKP